VDINDIPLIYGLNICITAKIILIISIELIVENLSFKYLSNTPRKKISSCNTAKIEININWEIANIDTFSFVNLIISKENPMIKIIKNGMKT
jgi:hypothetical protein